MALWQCDLRVSWRSQLFSLAVHAALILLILLTPWPPGYWMVWLILMVVMVFLAIRSQRRISAVQGEISLLAQDKLWWRGNEWKIRQPVWMIDSGILLSLRREHIGDDWRQAFRSRKHKLWLASDSMSQAEWRHLRLLLLTGKRGAGSANHRPPPL